MYASLTQREYLNWQKYWGAEPWGSWRDNLHFAIIGRELRRPQVKPGTKIDLNDFMIRDPDERRREGMANLITFLRSVAKPVKEPK